MQITEKWLRDPVLTPGRMIVAAGLKRPQELRVWSLKWLNGEARLSGTKGKPGIFTRLDALSLTLGRHLLDLGLRGPKIKSAIKAFRSLLVTGRYEGACLKITVEDAFIVQDGDVLPCQPDACVTMSLGGFVERELQRECYRGES